MVGAFACLPSWMLGLLLCHHACTCVLLCELCKLCSMCMCEFDGAKLATDAKQAWQVLPGMGLSGAEIGGGNRACITWRLHRPALTACKMPTLGNHQATRTALQPRSLNMFLQALGVYSHLQFTALQLDVPALSCTLSKMAICPCSF